MLVTKRLMLKLTVLLISLFIIKCIVNYKRVKLDGITGELLGIILSPETIYSKEYTDQKFLRIETGMTEKQVFKELGEPISIFNPYPSFKDSLFTKGIQYSKGYDLDAHYRLRIIYFRNGIVYEVRSRLCYID